VFVTATVPWSAVVFVTLFVVFPIVLAVAVVALERRRRRERPEMSRGFRWAVIAGLGVACGLLAFQLIRLSR
jgi:hypothetical protein